MEVAAGGIENEAREGTRERGKEGEETKRDRITIRKEEKKKEKRNDNVPTTDKSEQRPP